MKWYYHRVGMGSKDVIIRVPLKTYKKIKKHNYHPFIFFIKIIHSSKIKEWRWVRPFEKINYKDLYKQ